jgi:gas vesicle protein
MEKYGWGSSRSMMSMMWTHVAIGVGGAVVGVAAGMLLAPKSGGELRRLLWQFVTRKDALLEQHDDATNGSMDSAHDLGRASSSSADEVASAH